MAILIIIGYVLAALACLILLLIGFIKLLGFLADKGAEKKAKNIVLKKGTNSRKWKRTLTIMASF